MPKYRKHSIEEKRKHSARRKKVKKERKRKGAETNEAEKETYKQEEAKQPETSIAVLSEDRSEKATANQMANTADLATGQKGAESQKKSQTALKK